MTSTLKTRFVLLQTSHAGNVGAAARAIKVMGFDELVLVQPRWANVLRREETIQRASGAIDVLENCRIVETLDEALDGITHVCGTVMTARDFGPPTLTPREHFDSEEVGACQDGHVGGDEILPGCVLAPLGCGLDPVSADDVSHGLMRGRPGEVRNVEPSNLRAMSRRYQARMVSGLATQATC